MSTPGIVGRIATWIDSCAVHPSPVLSIGAALAIVGTAAGRRMCLPSGARGVLHVIGVGRTGVGKETARQCAIGALRAAGLEQRIGSDDVTSAAAIVALLRDHPTRLLLLDELGRLLEAYSGAGAASHELGIVTSIIRLWATAGHGTYLGRAYADRKPQSVVMPHLCMYATTTPASLGRAIKGSDVVDGVLSRLLIWPQDGGQAAAQTPTETPIEPPAEIVDALRELSGADDRGLPDSADIATRPKVVTLAPDCDALDRRITRICRAQLDGQRADIWVRAREQTHRVALVVAVGDGSEQVREEHLAWAWAAVHWSVAQTCELVSRHLADTEEGRCRLAVIDALRHGQMTRSELTRRLQRYERRVREAAIQTALDSGEVMRDSAISRMGKVATLLRLASPSEIDEAEDIGESESLVPLGDVLAGLPHA